MYIKLFFNILIFLSFSLTADYIKKLEGFKLGIIPVRADKSVYNPKDVPPFSAEFLDKRKFTNKTIKGPSIIVFWSVSCPACKRPMEELSKLDEKIDKEKVGVRIITVSPDNPQSIMAYFSKNKISLEAVVDTNSSVFRSFGAMATPLFYLIDKKGYVRGIIPGAAEVSSPSFWNLLKYLGS
jgi:peroxiredoxin